MRMKMLARYTSHDGHAERELVLVGRPDAPGRLLLLDVPRQAARTDDVQIVDDELTTIAEARLVAAGWATEHAVGGEASIADPSAPSSGGTAGRERELARYTTPAGERVVVGQRVAGSVCVSDRPADERQGGAVVLVQRGVATMAELDALVADYLAQSERRGEPARRTPSVLLDELAGALAA